MPPMSSLFLYAVLLLCSSRAAGAFVVNSRRSSTLGKLLSRPTTSSRADDDDDGILIDRSSSRPPPPQFCRRSPSSSSSSSLRMSMKPAYEEMTALVTEKLGLTVTDYCETYLDNGEWSSEKASGSARWLAEASPQYLTGVSACTRTNTAGGGLPAEEYTLNVWTGPSFDVPHLLLSFGQEEGDAYFVTTDYCPRGAVVMGSDPQYLEKYYGPEQQALWTKAHTAEEGSSRSLPPPPVMETRLLQSPNYLSVGGLSVGLATELVETSVRTHLRWLLDEAQPIPARLRGSFNLRDDKLRQFYYKGQVLTQVAALGDDEALGQTVAAVNTGPVSEAYVGGAS